MTPQTWWWQGPVATDLAAALANELQSTGTLQVVERRNLNAVLSEQELTELGIVRKAPGAATKGRMTGARYLVLGTITAYDSNVEEKTSGSTFGLLGFGKSQQALETKDYVAIDIRVVDSTTGEVVGARTVEGRASSVANANRQGVNLLPAAGAALLLFPNMAAPVRFLPAPPVRSTSATTMPSRNAPRLPKRSGLPSWMPPITSAAC